MKETSAMFCDHANECPASCPCSANCYCRKRTCKPRKLEAHVVELQFWATEKQRYVDHDNPCTPYLRWACSCGRIGPGLLAGGTIDGCSSATRRARNGGARHVAAMERGR